MYNCSVYIVCLCVFSSHLFWTSNSLDVSAGVTQEEGHTGFLIHLPSAVHAFIFLARRIQPFLSLVDREVGFFLCTNDLVESFSTCWAFLFLLLFFLGRLLRERKTNTKMDQIRFFLSLFNLMGTRIVQIRIAK